MLLHYMELVPEAILVVGREDTAKRVRKFARDLGLGIADGRIYGMVNVREIICTPECVVLIDNADYIIKGWPKRGYELIKHANIVTITKEYLGKNKNGSG